MTPATGPGPSAGAPGAPVHPVEPVVSTPPLGQGGNGSPPAGQPAPQAAAVPVTDILHLQAAVDGVNRFLRDSQRQFLFQIDVKSGKQTLTIVNPATGEVIRQIPSADVLAAAANLQQAGMPMTGLFIDEHA